ncbi:major facilitator superfamily domain-containing protein [Phthorimaea operculella]|nr:major facilitator superfamily domain-containing protein [Phthorimaea operculella]
MVSAVEKSKNIAKFNYDDALDCTGFGKYNIWMLTSCCLIILAMYLDVFGLSIVLPAIACDMTLTTMQQGVLSAAPLIGVMTSSYLWGLCADVRGRRWTLLMSMPVGAALNLATSFAPSYGTLVALKYLSGSFTSSANAAAFVLVGESFPKRHWSRSMFAMASATQFAQLVACMCALPIIQQKFKLTISEDLFFTPWRLIQLVISLPSLLGIIILMFLKESPKYLLSKRRAEDCLEVLRDMYSMNTGMEKDSFSVQAVIKEETQSKPEVSTTIFRKIWNQTAPLFQPPLLKNSLKLYFLLLCAYMTSTGYTMWIPTMTNAYFNGEDANGKTFCDVVSTVATSSNSTSTDCNNVIQNSTLYAVMCYSGGGGILTILVSFLVGFTGKRNMTAIVFLVSAACGIALLFTTTPLLSIALFCMFLYVALILGNINTYLVELNPTHLRGMATCLSVVVARGFGFMSVQLIGALLAEYCVPMVSGYIVMILAGFVVALFLPAEESARLEDPPKSNSGNIEAGPDKTTSRF